MKRKKDVRPLITLINTDEKQDKNIERVCRVCGCTDATPCMHTGIPCFWIEKDLCSDCASVADMEKFDEVYDQFNLIAMEVAWEYFEARMEHPTYPTYHHGAAVIREEYEELWDEVKKKEWDKKAMRKEAIQVATTAIRFVIDLIDNEVGQ